MGVNDLKAYRSNYRRKSPEFCGGNLQNQIATLLFRLGRYGGVKGDQAICDALSIVIDLPPHF